MKVYLENIILYGIYFIDSLRDVNAKIPGKNYRMATFRPNIVVQSKDGKAWAEDDWVGELHIGDAIFAVAQPCARW